MRKEWGGYIIPYLQRTIFGNGNKSTRIWPLFELNPSLVRLTTALTDIGP